MKLQQGLANIPLILGLLLLVVAVPVGVSLVQQNQNLQNRAYETTSIGSISCTEIFNAKLQYCSTTSPENTSGVPCTEIDYAISKYCIDIPTPTALPPTPTVYQITPQPSLKPTATPIPTTRLISPTPTIISKTSCITDQTKCAGRILYICKNNLWTLVKVCTGICSNGVCL